MDLEKVVLVTTCAMEAGQVPTEEALNISAQVATPLAHAICLTGGCFNDLSEWCCRCLAKGVHNHQLWNVVRICNRVHYTPVPN